MSKIETEDIDVLTKYWDSKLDVINECNNLLRSIENKLGNTGLVDIDQFYNLSQMSKMVNLSPYHIKKDIQSGKLKPLKRGGRAVFNKQQIDNYTKE